MLKSQHVLGIFPNSLESRTKFCPGLFSSAKSTPNSCKFDQGSKCKTHREFASIKANVKQIQTDYEFRGIKFWILPSSSECGNLAFALKSSCKSYLEKNKIDLFFHNRFINKSKVEPQCLWRWLQAVQTLIFLHSCPATGWVVIPGLEQNVVWFLQKFKASVSP